MQRQRIRRFRRKKASQIAVGTLLCLAFFSGLAWNRSESYRDSLTIGRKGKYYFGLTSEGSAIQIVYAGDAAVDEPLGFRSADRYRDLLAPPPPAVQVNRYAFNVLRNERAFEWAEIRLVSQDEEEPAWLLAGATPPGAPAGRLIGFPWGLITALLCIPTIIFITRHLIRRFRRTARLLRRQRRMSENRCPACAYDLTAHKPGDRCPECGAVIPHASPQG